MGGGSPALGNPAGVMRADRCAHSYDFAATQHFFTSDLADFAETAGSGFASRLALDTSHELNETTSGRLSFPRPFT